MTDATNGISPDRPVGPGGPGGGGRPADFETFYAAEYRDAVRLAYLLIGDIGAGEEIAQDAFVAIYGRWQRIDRPAAYLRSSIVNGCRDHGRRRGRWEARSHLAATEDAVTDQPAELTDALAHLPLRQRAALVLRFWGGLTESEIGDVLGVRPGTVKSLVHRGLASLRTELRP